MRLSAQDIRQEGQENGLDYRDVVAAASSGKAAWAITLSTPLICWLLQDLDVELLSWDSVPAIARPTSLHVRGYDQIYPPTNHPFITIEPKRYPIAYDGIVIDLSAPQHGYTCPIEHQESYFPHRVHCGISYEFSRQYKAHICNLREHRSAADKTEDILLEAFIRICCNTLHRKITELGADGIDNLFTMNSQYFEVFLKGLSVAVREELYAYQEHIDHVIYDPNDKEGRIQLFAHLDQQGYQAMTKAYDLRCEAMGS
ncbi:hypothetical protein P3342_007918 [Pyrenophora teres f. teres]|nr:hypothetical protein HRS9122_09575 [Pyrenophora teres f. teres]KAE8845162.1 hypothetical protein PTNB85_03427 [Pyrenophora teres f. teres]KAE8865691.1 hypothetical protein PTNB29_02838 [Pyrenophora teres f. teres]KAK1909746.1 hypothetical protein P3342_007918 [Pyrenophora teres f. teres]CAE7175183.1 hypothetical protein PTTW11_05763 [Pyrenophora teres f. teres]